MSDLTKPKRYIVIALTGSVGDTYQGCQVLPEGSFYPAIYSQVFGPASESECREWVKQNCGADTLTATDTGNAQLPLARSVAAVAVSHEGTLLIHVAGVTSGFDGHLLVEGAHGSSGVPVYTVREVPGNPGINPDASPDALPTVNAYAFAGEGGHSAITLRDANGEREVEVVKAEPGEIAAGEAAAGPVKPISAEWSAIHDFQPINPPTLTVRGCIELPTLGFQLKLTRAVPQGINPTILLLDLDITPPSGMAGQTITKYTVDYVEQTDHRFKTVTIRPYGYDVEVEEVH